MYVKLDLFLFLVTAPTGIYTLSLHDALPSSPRWPRIGAGPARRSTQAPGAASAKRFVKRSEEHTSELQSRVDLVWRLLLEKKKRVIRVGCLRSGVLISASMRKLVLS